MRIDSFRVFQVDYGQYGGEDGSILSEPTFDNFDTDGAPHQPLSNDLRHDQTYAPGLLGVRTH